MGLKSTLSSIQFTNAQSPDVARLNTAVVDMLRPVLLKEILDGALLKDISLDPAGVTQVSHKLQRAVMGYIVVKKNATADVWDDEANNDQKNLFLALNCSASCIVSLWVF